MNKTIALYWAKLDGSGVPRVMLNLAEGFRDRGFHVDVIVGNAVGALCNAVPEGVALYNLGKSRVIYTLPDLTRYLIERCPNALISAEDHANIVALWARRLARARSTRIAVTGHVLFSRRVHNTVFDRGYWVLWGINRFYPWADSVSTVSAGLADDMSRVLGYPRDRINVLYNPVVTPSMLEKARGPAPHPWFGDGNGPVVIGVGRLSEAKNFGALIEAVGKLREVRCIIIGEGPRRQQLETLIDELGIHDRVDLIGFQSNPYVFMAYADAFVLSSKFEGLPTVLIEAMALGCPVVATDCPHGPREILLDGALGPLVPVDDPDSLASAIAAVVERPVARDALEARAMDFHVDRVVDTYIEALRL